MAENLVIIPTYNEKENIEKIIRYVFNLPMLFHILVVEDNSPDGTADIVKKLIKEFPDRLFIEERKGKLGLGTAYIHGFKWALARDYQYVFEMDADFSHNPDDLIRLHDACANGADLAVLTLQMWCECRQLANEPRADVVLCLRIRALCHPYQCEGYYRRIRVLYA